MKITRAREHTPAILDGGAHRSGEGGLGRRPADGAEPRLGPVFGHSHAPVKDVEDLAADDRARLAEV